MVDDSTPQHAYDPMIERMGTIEGILREEIDAANALRLPATSIETLSKALRHIETIRFGLRHFKQYPKELDGYR